MRQEIKKGVLTGVCSGIIASFCCLGPLIIIFLGLGTIPFALSITQYRPFFLALGIFFIVGAIILHLRMKNKTCDINCFSLEGIKKEKHFIFSIVLSMGITYFLLLYGMVPRISPIIYRSFSQNREVLKQITSLVPNENLNLQTLVLKIERMTCESCAGAIEWYFLNQLRGIKEVKIDFPKGKAEIIYNPKEITKEEILHSEIFKIYKATILNGE